MAKQAGPVATELPKAPGDRKLALLQIAAATFPMAVFYTLKFAGWLSETFLGFRKAGLLVDSLTWAVSNTIVPPEHRSYTCRFRQ